MESANVVSLPDLDRLFEISAKQVESFQRDGYLKITTLLTAPEVAAYRPAIVGAAERFNTERRALGDRDTYGRAFLQIMNLWVRDEAVRRFTLAKRFGHVAARLLKVEKVRLYHDQALFKEPGGGKTPWHQDQHYWPLDTDKTITLWMPLVNASEAMGTMRFGAGSHVEGYLGDLPISDDSEAQIAALIAEKGYSIVKAGAMTAGDATFHSGWCLHGADGNSSDQMREVMTIIYFADGTRVGHADNANRANDLATWLPGLKPGDLAASELNPLV